MPGYPGNLAPSTPAAGNLREILTAIKTGHFPATGWLNLYGN
jgi:hypothetical protein